MLFAGFGFLMTFLQNYGYSAISFTIIITATVTEFAILLIGFTRLEPGDYIIKINFLRLVLNSKTTIGYANATYVSTTIIF